MKMDVITDGEDKTLDMIWEAIQEHEQKLAEQSAQKRGLAALKVGHTDEGEKK